MHFRPASLLQLILRSISNVISLAILGTIVYGAVEFDQLYGMTITSTMVSFVYNAVLIIAYWKLYRGRPAPGGKAVDLDNLPRLALSELFVVAICSVSAGLIMAKGKDHNSPWKLIAFGLQIAIIPLQLTAGVLACEGCLKESDKYVPVEMQARDAA